MLEDVGSAFWVRREGLKDRSKGVVFIITLEMVDFGTGLFVDELIDLDFEVVSVVAGEELVSLYGGEIGAEAEGGESFSVGLWEFDHN